MVTTHGQRAWTLVCAALTLSCGARTGLAIDEAGTDAAVDVGVDAFVELVCDREIEIAFTPTSRAQIAVWIESDLDGGRFETLSLTEATARYGIGNRPGALQMNSGYRWPYGRRESVLPGWAGSRLDAGGTPFPRVVFRSRIEGHASRADAPADAYRDTPDDYSCLSFNSSASDRDHLDAVTCPSPFTGDKGRYLSASDVATAYAEPQQTAPGVGEWRALSLGSAYPPRRDLVLEPGHFNHPDVERFASDAERAMPEIDSVTTATPPGGRPVSIRWEIPDSWPAGPARVSVEVNTEGDYADTYGPDTLPTPTSPPDGWDYWAQNYGYPYRGQPSVIFDVVVAIPPRGSSVAGSPSHASVPSRMGTLDGSLATSPVDGTIRDDPSGSPGSGADRLQLVGGARVTVSVLPRCRPAP
jgi:hypothetical protein